MGELGEVLWANNFSQEPASPLYEVKFPELMFFASLELTKFLLEYYGQGAVLGNEVLEVTYDGTYRKRSIREDEKEMLLGQPQA